MEVGNFTTFQTFKLNISIVFLASPYPLYLLLYIYFVILITITALFFFSFKYFQHLSFHFYAWISVHFIQRDFFVRYIFFSFFHTITQQIKKKQYIYHYNVLQLKISITHTSICKVQYIILWAEWCSRSDQEKQSFIECT